MSIRDANDLKGLREAGRIVKACLEAMRKQVRPGVTTAEINAVGAETMRRNGARSAPMLVYGFPGENCISVNDEIVHGIPGERRLVDGDIVKLDVTVEKDGCMADAAVSAGVGSIAPTATALIDCAERAFLRAMTVARAGKRISRIGREVEREVTGSGFKVVRELTGHGIGKTIHEPPIIPNYEEPLSRQELTEGLVITVEPLVAMGSGVPVESGDGWTVRTADGAIAAHHEHTIVITNGRPMLLTA